MDTYQVIADNLERPVPNPAQADLKGQLTAARARLTKLMAANSVVGLEPEERKWVEAELRQAREEVSALEAQLEATPTKVRLRELEPEARQLAPEQRLLAHAIRLSVFNAESALAWLLAPSYRRAQDEARSVLREAFKVSGDLRVLDGYLEVRFNPLSAPRRTAALAGSSRC